MEYSECKAPNCDNHIPQNYQYCSWHLSLIRDRFCANIFTKGQVDWCRVNNKRVDGCDSNCKDWLDPKLNFERMEKLRKLEWRLSK